MLEHIDRRRKGRSVFLIECDQAILLAQFSAESLLSCAARCKQKPRCTAKKLWIVLKFPHRYPNQRRSEEHTSELQSLMRISYAVFCLKKKYETQTEKLQTLQSISQTY